MNHKVRLKSIKCWRIDVKYLEIAGSSLTYMFQLFNKICLILSTFKCFELNVNYVYTVCM